MFGTRVSVEPGGRASTIAGLLLAVVVTLAAPHARSQALLDMPQYQQLKAAWSEVRSDLESGAWEEAAGQIHHLVSIRTDLGLPNAYVLSAALLQAAHAAADADDTVAATKLAAAAASLSPDMAGARFEEASLLFASTPFGVGDQLKSMRLAVEALPHDLGTTFALMGNTASALLHGLIVLVLLFALAMVVRYWTPWAFDLTRLLPAGVTQFQGTLLLATLLVAPFFLGLGALTTVVVWVAIAAFYMRTLERVVSLLLLASMATLPFLASYSVRAVRFAGTPEAVLERCNNSLCSVRDRQRLARMAKTTEFQFDANYTLALQEKRSQATERSSYSDAMKRLNMALKAEDRPEGLVLMGTLLYLEALAKCNSVLREDAGAKDDFEARLRNAVDSFKRAAKADPNSVPANYNAGALLRQLGNPSDAENFENKVTELDAPAGNRFTTDVARDNNKTACQMSNLGNRHLMDARLSSASLRESAMAREATADSLLMPLAGALTGRLGPRGVGLAAAVGAVLVFLLLLAGGLLPVSRHCVVCHGVADPNTRVDADRGASVCKECVQADVHRGISDAKETWTRDQKIQADAFKRARAQRWVTWFLPGFGQVLRGAPVRGVLFTTLVFASLIVGFGLHQIIVDARQPATVGSGRMFLFGSVAVVAYLVALFDAHAARSDVGSSKKVASGGKGK